MRRSSCCARTCALLATATLAACGTLDGLSGRSTPPEPAVDRTQTQALLVSGHLETLQRLLASGPAEQAEIVATARREYDEAATASRQLRYALVLATPGHASTDVTEAQRLLRERNSTASRRLQAELEENARLRKALEDAQKKLDAIANIERTITERKPQSEGRTP